MKTNIASIALLLALALVTPAGARGDGESIDDVASRAGTTILTERLLGTTLRIEPSFSYQQAVLRVAGPSGYALTKRFAAAGQPIEADLLVEAEPPWELGTPSVPGESSSGHPVEALLWAALPDGRYVYEVELLDRAGGTRTHVGRFAVESGAATLVRSPGKTPAPTGGDAAAPGERIAAKSVTEADFIKINDSANDGTTFLSLDSDESDGSALETWGLFNRFGDLTIEECGDGSNLGLCQRVGLALLDDGSSARVGIGTSAPTQDLHVHGPDGGDLRLTGGSGGADYTLATGSSSGDLFIRSIDDGLIKDLVRITQGAASGGVVLDENGLRVRDLKVINHGLVSGRVGIGIASVPSVQLHVGGDGIIEGDVSLGSSRTIKHAIQPLDGAAVLESVRELPLYRWKYKADPEQALHVGPMAEDVHAAFRLGRDDKHLSPADSAGLALAAIQGVDAELQSLRQSHRELIERNRALEQRIEELERLGASGLSAGAARSGAAPVERIPPDVLVAWNEKVLAVAEAEDRFLTLKGVRTAALMHLAIHDALNAIEPRYRPYLPARPPEPGARAQEASPLAAAAEAAYRVAVDQYPDRRDVFEAERRHWLQTVPTGAARERGREVGAAAAERILAAREGDGWDNEAEYRFHPMAPGVYAEFAEHSGTPQGFVIGAGWATARPFVLDAPDHFRAPPPPAIESDEYTRAFQEVKEVGRHESEARTPDQSHFAMWWKEFVESSHNRLARELVAEEGLGLWEAARMFALLETSIFDAYVNVFENKFHYNHWRPYTAIRWAASDGNRDTEPEPDWNNLHRHTYPFPSYPSAHGTACAAAMTVLASVFGEERPVTITIPEVDEAGPFSDKVPMDPASRSFPGFSAAARECSLSRVYLGIHFRYDSEAGTDLGGKVGRYVVENALRPVSPS